MLQKGLLSQDSDTLFVQQLLQGEGERVILNSEFSILGASPAIAALIAHDATCTIEDLLAHVSCKFQEQLSARLAQTLAAQPVATPWPLLKLKPEFIAEDTQLAQQQGNLAAAYALAPAYQPVALPLTLPSGERVLMLSLLAAPVDNPVDTLGKISENAVQEKQKLAEDKEAEAGDKLAELAPLLRDMVQASNDPMMVLSAEPQHYQEVLYANPAVRDWQNSWPIPETFEAEEDLKWQPHLLTWPWGERDREQVKLFLSRLEQGDYTRREYYLPDLGQWWNVEPRPIERPPERVHGRQRRGLAYWVVLMKNVTQRRRDEQLVQVRNRATALSLQDKPLTEVLSCFLKGLEELAEGWWPSVLHMTSDGCELYGEADTLLRDWVQQIPVEHVQAKWRQRDPYRTGKAFVSTHPPLGQAHQDASSLVGTVVEVGLYDRNKQLFGSLTLTHPDISEGVSHRTPSLCRMLENSAPDISLILERDKQRQKLEFLAYKDALTGLLNRAGFLRETRSALQQAYSAGQEVALGLLDLNRFKQVNDSLGHVLGDELLSMLAHRLNDLTQRYPMTALARMGGDEFAFLLHDTTEIHEVSRALADALGAPFIIDNQPIRINIALGWSLFPATADELTTLLKQADSAMYAAKRGGHTTHIYAPTQQPRISTFALENALYEAMQTEQFEIIYQPQVRCNTRELIGAEALIRWTHPTLGQVSPDLFIPVAESTGLIHELGAWVLREACRAAQAWESDISVSVNVSAVQLRSEYFQRSVWEALHQSGLSPSRLILEMTETALLSDTGEAKARLRELRRQGVRVSVDDFGTGYSTLLTLRQLLADELKIDRTFTRDLNLSAGGDEGWAIVQSTVALARALGMKVVAEGVETEMQAEALREMGCDYIQGWLVAPGLREKSFADFVAFQMQKNPQLPSVQSQSERTLQNQKILTQPRSNTREQRAIAALLSFGIS